MKLFTTLILAVLLGASLYAEVLILDTPTATAVNGLGIPGVTAATGDQFLTTETTYVADQTAQDTAIGLNAGNIGTNATGIVANTAGVANNTNGIQANGTAITGNTTHINQHSNEIIANQNGIAQNSTDITTKVDTTTYNAGQSAQDAVTTQNTNDIGTNAGDIASNTSGVANNSTNISQNSSSIASNSGAIITETTRAQGIEAGLRTDTDTNTGGVANNSYGVSQNAQGVSNNATGVQNNAQIHNSYVAQQAQVDADQNTQISNNSSGIRTNRRLYDQLRATTVALSSVELNPDHKGLSIGIGFSPNGGTKAGAMGIMYGIETKGDYSVGVNVKAYNAEGTGGTGFGTGITVGF